MANFFTRLFGGNNNIIKDPQLGKIRYLESEHGNTWAGSIQITESQIKVEFFLVSSEKILKHESRTILIDLLDNYKEVHKIIQTEINRLSKPINTNELALQIIHIPEQRDSYDAELIFNTSEGDMSVIWRGMEVEELIVHD